MTGRPGNTPRPRAAASSTPGEPRQPEPRAPGRGTRRRAGAEADQTGWIWGRHAGLAALANPNRQVHDALITRNAAHSLGLDPASDPRLALAAPAALDAALPPGAVHQGLALRVAPLQPAPLAALARPAEGILVLLDQVTDPHNVGAIVRSVLAFGGRGVVLQDRKAPPFLGACAKAAVGAAERVAQARVVNLARALETLREAGWRSVGLAGAAPLALEEALAPAQSQAEGGLVLALGAEDKGLRPSVAAACDVTARIPIEPDAESLNVSTAAAVALYAACRRGAARGG